MKFMKITNVHYTEKQQSSQEAAAEEQHATLRFSGGWGHLFKPVCQEIV